MGLFKKVPFGLDISDLSIQVMQLSNKRKIISSNYIDIDSGIIENGKVLNADLLVEALNTCVGASKPKPIKTREVIASLPDSQLFAQVCVVREPADSKNFQAALEQEVRADMPLDLDDLYADYQIFYPGTDKQEVLFVAAPKELVNSYHETLVASGLKPVALDMESGCLGRCLLEDDFGGDNSVLIVDIGARNTIIGIFIPEGLYFSTDVTVAGNEFSRKIADKLKIKFGQAEKLKIKFGVAEKNDRQGVGKIIKEALEPIAKEIEEVIEYNKYKLGKAPKKIFVVGGASAMTGLIEYLKERLGVDVSLGDTKKRPM
nr:pilus assembly protein PilM [Candidatus Saccharibacteria bacterium]